MANPRSFVLEYPTHSAPTASIQINPIYLTRAVQYQYTPYQQRLVAVGGREYVLELAPTVELLMEIDIRDLPEESQGDLEGWTALYSFLRNTLRWSVNTCSLTDPDSVRTDGVRLWTPQVALREMEGQALRAGYFSGTLTFRQTVS